MYRRTDRRYSFWKKKEISVPEIESEARAWQAPMLPLHHTDWGQSLNTYLYLNKLHPSRGLHAWSPTALLTSPACA